MRIIVMLSVVTLLSACSSAPLHYYTLLPTALPVSSTPNHYRLAMAPITLPTGVERPELTVRVSPSRVMLLENRHWIAPLAEQIHELLATELAPRQDAASPASSGVPRYKLAVSIRRFEALPGKHTLLVADWRLTPAGNGPAIACESRITEPVGNKVSAIVGAQRRGLMALAGSIGQVLTRLADDAKASCPNTD